MHKNVLYRYWNDLHDLHGPLGPPNLEARELLSELSSLMMEIEALSCYLVLKQGRGLIWPSLGQTQKVKLISQILGKVKTFMFHIYSKIHEWFCTLKTMNGRSLWINGLFSRPNGLTRCIFFHSFHSWKNMQLVSPFGLSKRPFIHTDQPFIVFFVQSFIFFIMNVEKEQCMGREEV